MKSSYIKISKNKFQCLIAETEHEKQMGLMYVQPPAPIMLFPYKSAENCNFWMKNTPAPLELLFCKDNKIHTIKEGEPYSTQLIKGGMADLVIEVPKGYVSKYSIKIGDEIEIW